MRKIACVVQLYSLPNFFSNKLLGMPKKGLRTFQEYIVLRNSNVHYPGLESKHIYRMSLKIHYRLHCMTALLCCVGLSYFYIAKTGEI